MSDYKYFGPAAKYYIALDCSTYPAEKVIAKNKDLLKLCEEADKKVGRENYIIGYEFDSDMFLII